MILQSPPAVVPYLPESAPFTPEQRAWLNGFFAGIFSADAAPGATALSAEASAALMPGGPAAAAEDDGAPWHDAAMPLGERMKLAEGRPLARRMMAAMAQQDCGQCGYLCETYSKAIADGTETALNLCAPGGKETLRMLKALAAEQSADGAAPTAAPAASAPPVAAPAAPRGTRENPGEVTFLGRTRLNKDGSAKETWHIEFDLAGSGIDYAAGDSLGLFPVNDPGLVAAVLAALDAPADYPVGETTLGAALSHGVCLKSAPDALFTLFSYLTGGTRKAKARALAAGEDPDGDAATLDVLAALEKFAGTRPDPEAVIECLEPLQPRLYSISSSPKATPGRLSLTVDAVRYEAGGRTRLGVCSTFLGGRVPPGTRMKAYLQKAHGFGLPAESARPIIMVGPGTGIAPFRAFLHERMATRAPGRNWLFFGHQRRDTDFFYEDELAGLQAAGVLTRLDTAWSRDGAEKVYVQDRIRQAGAELWAWLSDGAHFYICGDAQRMAKDVEAALVDVAAAQGGLARAAAANFLADLKKAGRYQADVY
ncbi:sulfite reductase subunit alpha [Aquabacter spiritensis]|uniref:assimilatory sulfite reductase (NADPH) n=1 Tax=Aquabacter spiritensis TaxID=933073 RepID=A0A4R3M4Q4_9HYPH|nr:sulfite reductase subunit alpha [Aquabacter spiritensis]TCT08012.1 NAD(P)H-dependent nitrite reductase flavoprotein subunit [Aquabacter spiritensis]